MGLDMYLERSHFIGGQYCHGKIKVKVGDDPSAAVAGSKIVIEHPADYIGEKEIKIDINKVSRILENVAYWRKANAIHNWFIQNCANGVDDCRPVYVDPSQLIELRKICEDILKGPEGRERDSAAEALLPTYDGCCFGTTEYGEWYYQQLQNTVNMLKDITEEDTHSYYYEASW